MIDCYKLIYFVDGINMGVVLFYFGLINGKGIIKIFFFMYLLLCIINIVFLGFYI